MAPNRTGHRDLVLENVTEDTPNHAKGGMDHIPTIEHHQEGEDDNVAAKLDETSHTGINKGRKDDENAIVEDENQNPAEDSTLKKKKKKKEKEGEEVSELN